MAENKTTAKILKILLKDLAIKPTITSLAKETEMSRVGMWKVLKKLEKDKLVVLSQIGTGKTSTYRLSLNWENPLVEKTLSLALTEDALKNQRWRSNFAELEDKLDFLIIYGSIIHSPKEANDIDILAIVSSKSSFKQIDYSTLRIQKTQTKKIHVIDLTNEEFKAELKKPNKAFIDAVKKGIVLFGQEKFIKFVKKIIK
ncbi:MAG: hypothetical protein Q8N99_03915 [Nanoarchaeota archaeon]|nr:hypothetical protein [Nanoarchaeota archaeon]